MGRRELWREECDDAQNNGGERRDGHRRGTVHRLRRHEYGRQIRGQQIDHAPVTSRRLARDVGCRLRASSGQQLRRVRSTGHD